MAHTHTHKQWERLRSEKQYQWVSRIGNAILQKASNISHNLKSAVCDPDIPILHRPFMDFLCCRSANSFFELEWRDGRVCVRAANKKYVIAKKNGQLAATVDSAGEWRFSHFWTFQVPELSRKFWILDDAVFHPLRDEMKDRYLAC